MSVRLSLRAQDCPHLRRINRFFPVQQLWKKQRQFQNKKRPGTKVPGLCRSQLQDG
jgi:hypothetical protein